MTESFCFIHKKPMDRMFWDGHTADGEHIGGMEEYCDECLEADDQATISKIKEARMAQEISLFAASAMIDGRLTPLGWQRVEEGRLLVCPITLERMCAVVGIAALGEDE